MKTINVEKTASRGIVMGKVYIINKPSLKAKQYLIEEQYIQEEINKYEHAVTHAEEQLIELAKENDIFAAHLEMVKDFTLYEGVTTKIKEDKYNAEHALENTIAELVQIFEDMDDEYMRERAADIKDVKNRLMSVLKGVNVNAFENITEKVIIVADDLTPSDTSSMNLSYILGFITQDGGVTSHVSIMAKGLGLPALVGVKDIINQVKQDDFIIMDAGSGQIIINPDEETRINYQGLLQEYDNKQKILLEGNHLPSITVDGRSVHLCANVGKLEDVKNAIQYHIDGIGLFRSEFLYMESNHFPTEEEQFEVYKQAVLLSEKEVTIRTLDIGGDKSLSYYEFEKEENPFLGWRAIRISLELKDIFKNQLRAILRASAFGSIRIMFPMIISLEELRMSKDILEECKVELDAQNIIYDYKIKVGMMIETPASVMCVEDFSKEVDFFSIGTNDLTQYILAVDRGNKKIANMYNSFHPAVLRSIKRVIQAGHDNNIQVGMCGEFASDERAVQLLLGLGLDEFSMAPTEIANVKYIIRKSSYDESKVLAETVCLMNTIQEIYRELKIV